MGTRNLTVVISKETHKVAQYGQWDGYPEGQGAVILNFLRKMNKVAFTKKVDALAWATPEQAKKVNATENWTQVYPWLSRDAGGEILKMIMENDGIFLTDSITFSGDSLFCEWAYVVDLDKNTFEVYEGFNRTPIAETERFFKYFERPEPGKAEVFYPVKFVKSYSLDALPTEEEFLADFSKQEECE